MPERVDRTRAATPVSAPWRPDGQTVAVIIRPTLDQHLRSFLHRLVASRPELRTVVALTDPRAIGEFHFFGDTVVVLRPPGSLRWTESDALSACLEHVRGVERGGVDVVVALAPRELDVVPEHFIAGPAASSDGTGPTRSRQWRLVSTSELERLVGGTGSGNVVWRPYLRQLRGPAALSTVFVVLTVAFELVYPWPLKVLVDHLSGEQVAPGWVSGLGGDDPLGVAVVLGVISVVLVAGDALTSYASTTVTGRATERLAGDMRVSVFSRITHLSMGFFDRYPSGELLTRLNGDVARVQGATVQVLTSLFPDLLRLAGILAVLMVLDPLLALVGLLALPILALVVAARRRRTKALQRRARAVQGHLTATASELLRNVRLFKSFGAEPHAIDRYRAVSDAAVDAEIDSLRNTARFSPVADIALAVVSAFVMLIGVVRVTDGQLTIGSLLVVFSYLTSLYGPARSLAGLGQLITRTVASRERLADVFDERLPSEHAEAVRSLGSVGTIGAQRSNAVSLSGVGFAYRPGHHVLHGIDLVVPPGAHVCIVGPSGQGKTTILHLILRLYEVSAGSIALDGVDVRDLPLSLLRSRVGLVPQESWIIDASLRENLLVGAERVSLADLEEAIALANLQPLIDTLPDGLHTPLGESGQRVSGGERKRIALARALVRRPDILLLDEPTSGLDARNEANVIEVIAGIASPRSVLSVTHSERLAASADVVYELHDRRLFAHFGRPHRVAPSVEIDRVLERR